MGSASSLRDWFSPTDRWMGTCWEVACPRPDGHLNQRKRYGSCPITSEQHLITKLQGHWFPRGVISFDDPLHACEIAARAEVAMAPQLCLMPGLAAFRDGDMMVRLVGGRYGAGRGQACAAFAAGAPCSLAPAQTLRISWTATGQSFWKCQRPPILRCYYPHKPSFNTIQKGVEDYLGSSTPHLLLAVSFTRHFCPSHLFLSAETRPRVLSRRIKSVITTILHDHDG